MRKFGTQISLTFLALFVTWSSLSAFCCLGEAAQTPARGHLMEASVIGFSVPAPLPAPSPRAADGEAASPRRLTTVFLSGIAVSLALSTVVFFLLARALEQRVRERTEALQEANRRLEELAYRDELTQLFNRRFFHERLQTEWQRAMRVGECLSVILCDVDHFKRYNDTYGHQAGDECLRQVAQAIPGALKRPADLAARFGGEEFVILLPNTSRQGALAVAEQIRAGVEARRLEHRASPTGPCVTLSLGVMSAVPGPDQAPGELIAGADEALYRAKHQGRNRAGVFVGAAVTSVTTERM